MIDFEAIIERKKEREKKIIEFNKKKDKYFEYYEQCFLKRGYDKRTPLLFDKLSQFCAYYCVSVNKKGLFLCAKEGDVNTGIGKTLGMHIISDIFKIRIETVVKLSEAFSDNKNRYDEMLTFPNYINSRKRTDLIIDEVGAEAITNSYGKKLEVFIDVLETRYDKFISEGSYTHFTSNLTKKQLESRYGHRVWSRINEMTTVIEVSGVDRRFE